MGKQVQVFLWNGNTIMFLNATDWEAPVGILHVMRAGDPLIYSYPLTSVEHWETLPATLVSGPVSSAEPAA